MDSMWKGYGGLRDSLSLVGCSWSGIQVELFRAAVINGGITVINGGTSEDDVEISIFPPNPT